MRKLLLSLAATGLLGTAAALPAAPASAQQRVVVRERTVVNHHRPRWGTRTVCRSTWRHGRKIRTCRKVRYRR